MSGLQSFIDDITPFFHGRPITYVDVGAYEGVVYSALADSSIKVRNAYLIEPNPTTYRSLSRKFHAPSDRSIHLHNVAIGMSGVTVRMIDRNDMSHVVVSTAERDSSKETSDTFEVDSTSLDEFLLNNDIDNISLLKIDVEGHEMPVLEGASAALSDERIDILYVEAGIDPKNNQQTYYRLIEDYLAKFNYRIFRIYEQTNEWIVDSPILRRVNIAFMSESFARNNPYKLSREISVVRRENEALKKTLSQFEVERDKLKSELEKLREKAALADESVALQEENQSLKDELTRLESDYQAARLELAGATQKQQDLSDSLTSADAHLSVARQSVEQLEKQLDERHRELSILILEIDKERAQNGDLRSSLALLEGRLQKQKDLYRQSIDDFARLEAKIASDAADYEGQIRVQIRKRKSLQERVETQQNQIESQRKALSQMEKSAAKSQSALDAISNSTVWRATSPLRKVASSIKRLLK